MQDADALWYDYETEETVPSTNRRWRSLRLVALTVITAMAASVGYGLLAIG